MKNLKELKDIKILSKKEQKMISGGYACVDPDHWCPPGTRCCGEICRVIGKPCY